MRAIIGTLLVAITIIGCTEKPDGIDPKAAKKNMDFIEPSLLGEVTLWLSKSGELYRADELKALSKKISADQAIELYTYFRDNGERWESEWRKQFISIFPQSEQALPPIAEADRWQKEIFEVIDADDLQGVKEFIARTRILENTKFDPAKTYREGRGFGFSEKVEYIPFDFFPVQTENENGEYPVPYARSRGKIEIAVYLESVIEELSQRYRDAFQAGRKTKD